jgi:antirestriction protein
MKEEQPSTAIEAAIQPAELRPRIYVASLADYNNGRLHGDWLDATADAPVIQAGIDQMLDASPEPGAEEYAIHDYDDFAGLRLGEYESIDTVVRVARGLQEHGRAFAAWAKLAGVAHADADSFRAHYLGSWGTIGEYAWDLEIDLGVDRYLSGIPPDLKPYIHFDARAFVRDAISSGELASRNDADETHVFLAPGTG